MAEQPQPNAEPQTKERPKNLFVLITQCLQNSFFLDEECQLCLPSRIVEQMLIGSEGVGDQKDSTETKSGFRSYPTKSVQSGPLYSFLNTVINNRVREDPLHIISIKDWHERTSNYDQERRTYGTHCEADTEGAKCINGFEELLEPWTSYGDRKTQSAAHREALTSNGYQREINYFYEMRSDTLFDFQAKEQEAQSTLKMIFDKLTKQAQRENRRLYVIVIGVYTDIKIMTLLTSLRSLYHLDNLITSDILTAAPTLERHLAGLDYCDKVLKVEIIHSLNDLAAQFAPRHAGRISREITKNLTDFRHYRSYYQDKQNVLAYQDDKLAQYIDMTGRRAANVYQWIYKANLLLMGFGFIFLFLTVYAAAMNLAYPDTVRVELVLITGGLSISQLLIAFIGVPSRDMQANLYRLVRLRNYLEAYSTISALLRHHFTRAELLQTTKDPDTMLELLKKQIEIFDMFARQMKQNFGSISADDTPPLSNGSSSGTTTASVPAQTGSSSQGAEPHSPADDLPPDPPTSAG